jgi:hypothetical protein|tara:strand:+ start:326 stop:508 length:183 start_codon:yes stop_codon:yes gene_type:complete
MPIKSLHLNPKFIALVFIMGSGTPQMKYCFLADGALPQNCQKLKLFFITGFCPAIGITIV